MSLLEQDIIKKGQVDLGQVLPKLEEFEARDNKEYEVKTMIDSAVYGQQVNNQISGLYYLILWKSYSKEENTWEPILVVIYFWKLINTFHKEHSEKPIATSSPLDSVLLVARLLVLKEPK